MTVCKAKKTGQVNERGRASLEWRDKDGTPNHRLDIKRYVLAALPLMLQNIIIAKGI